MEHYVRGYKSYTRNTQIMYVMYLNLIEMLQSYYIITKSNAFLFSMLFSDVYMIWTWHNTRENRVSSSLNIRKVGRIKDMKHCHDCFLISMFCRHFPIVGWNSHGQEVCDGNINHHEKINSCISLSNFQTIFCVLSAFALVLHMCVWRRHDNISVRPWALHW